jgi:hypothetical protein
VEQKLNNVEQALGTLFETRLGELRGKGFTIKDTEHHLPDSDGVAKIS